MLPQEVEIWYIIPSLRRELANVLKEKHKLNQKKIASIIKVSPAAVSQYAKEKRAKEVHFNGDIKRIIDESAGRLAGGSANFTQEMVKLTQSVRSHEFICKVHQLYDPEVNPNCRDCFISNVR